MKQFNCIFCLKNVESQLMLSEAQVVEKVYTVRYGADRYTVCSSCGDYWHQFVAVLFHEMLKHRGIPPDCAASQGPYPILKEYVEIQELE